MHFVPHWRIGFVKINFLKTNWKREATVQIRMRNIFSCCIVDNLFHTSDCWEVLVAAAQYGSIFFSLGLYSLSIGQGLGLRSVCVFFWEHDGLFSTCSLKLRVQVGRLVPVQVKLPWKMKWVHLESFQVGLLPTRLGHAFLWGTNLLFTWTTTFVFKLLRSRFFQRHAILESHWWHELLWSIIRCIKSFWEVHWCLPAFTLLGCLLLLPLNFSIRNLKSFGWAPHVNVTRTREADMLICCMTLAGFFAKQRRFF